MLGRPPASSTEIWVMTDEQARTTLPPGASFVPGAEYSGCQLGYTCYRMAAATMPGFRRPDELLPAIRAIIPQR